MNLPARAFESITDCVAVLDDRGVLVDANPFMLGLLGYARDEVVGRSMADFVHPDDLERAIRVVGMVATDTLDVPVTPALYRLLAHDGTWLPVEINGTLLTDEASGATSVVIIGRYSADRNLQDQMMERLVSGEPPTDVIELVPEFGRWRHLLDHYAVIYTDDHGHLAVTGSESILALIDLDDPDTPWAIAGRRHEEAVVELDGMPGALAERAAKHGLGPCWVLPVDDDMHERAAVIVVWARREGPDIEVHRYAIETMARALAVILQWRHHVAGLLDAARHDPLTGLANRTGFWEVLDALARDHASPLVAVLYVDLDGFKSVNDRFGHRTGDVVLTEAAQRIAAVIRPGDTIARLGGDEFAIVCGALASPAESIAIAERVLGALSAPIDVSDDRIEVGASIGIATALGHELRADELLEAADAALYEAKRAGSGSWHMAGSSAEGHGTLDP